MAQRIAPPGQPPQAGQPPQGGAGRQKQLMSDPEDYGYFPPPPIGGMPALPDWGAASALTRIPGIGGPGTEYGAMNVRRRTRSGY